MNKNKSESFIYLDKINNKICDKLIDFYESGLGTAGVAKTRGLMGNPPTYDPVFKDSEESFYTCFPIYYAKALLEINNKFKKKFIYSDKMHCEWNIVEPIKIQKYYPGQAFKGWHYENNGSSKMGTRHLVFMTYLNDIKYGGETEWFYQKIKIKPKKGLTVIWPAQWTHTHRGLIAPKEIKYIVTGWFNYVKEGQQLITTCK